MQTITNDNGDIVTRINVSRIFTYDVETIVRSIREDNRAGEDDELIITLDDVIEYVNTFAHEDFAYYDMKDLIFQDENGNNY